MRRKQIIILGVVMVVALVGLIFTQAAYFRTAFQLKKTQFDYLVYKSMNETITVLEEENRRQKEIEKQIFDAHQLKEDSIIYMPIGTDIHSVIQNTANLNILRDFSLSVEYDRSEGAEDVLWGNPSNRNLQYSIEKSRQELKKSLGKEYDLVVVSHNDNSDKTLKERIGDLDIYEILTEQLKSNGIDAHFEYAIKEKGEFSQSSSNFFYHHSDYSYSRNIYLGETKSVASLFLIFPDQTHGILASILLIFPSLIITILLIICFAFCILVIMKQKKLSMIKNDFINNMTHEFKTPIATISLASQMLKDGAVSHSPSTIDHIAGIIRDESKRLTYQVEKVLQTALFTETRMKLKLKSINLNDIVENLATKFNLRVEDKGGQLYYYLEADYDEIYADEVHITNVISNLLDNAIKYCSKAPEISIYTRNKNDEIIVSVTDNGIGIAAKEQKLIFERFYRISTGNLHDVKGFGLGLSYVKSIVEAHGGRVVVESAEGKGSRFDIILPLMVKKQKIKRTLFF